MNTIIIGSRALDHFNIKLTRLVGIDIESRDIDIFFNENNNIKNPIKEDAHPLPDEIFNMIEQVDGYATPKSILTIKMSHLAWDIHWEKTKNDIIELMYMGVEYDVDLYHSLKNHWMTVHGNKDFLSLKMDKEEFFNDFVDYVYDHDYLHELVAFPNDPMYTHCLKDGEDVLIDKSKFFKLDFEQQVSMFAEEITVIAIERWMIHDKSISWFKAYQYALKKTITNLTKNWANDFLIFNLPKFIHPVFERFEHAMDVLQIKYTADLVELLVVWRWFNSKSNIELSIDQFITYLSVEDKYWDFIGDDERVDHDFMKKFLKDINHKIVDIKRRCDGAGDYVRSIFSFSDENLYISVEYLFNNFDIIKSNVITHTVRNVKPVTKKITVFE